MSWLFRDVHEVTEAEIRMKEDGEVRPCPVPESKIVDFYKNKCVLLTGATGFLGKLTVEKLLRVCDDIDTIYILVRPKKGVDEETRIDKLYSDPVFEPLRKYRPKFQHKISILKGDVGAPNLGLSDQDQHIVRTNVDVIYHIAATVRFDEKITTATAINVRGTRDLLNLAKSCQKLKSFVYVSTAFANVLQKDIDEIFYTPKIPADELISLLETKTDTEFIAMTDSLVHPWPNTYAFTKAVAENCVKTHGQGLPICVFRPSIVSATYREPVRGWIDNVYGVTGVLIGSGTGFMRVLHCEKKCTAEIVPGDLVINGMIASSYATVVEKNDDIKVYNYVSSVENRIDWATLMNYCEFYGIPNPPHRSLWCYCLALISNKYWYNFLFFMLHYVPGFLVDFGLRIAGKEPMMVKVYQKVKKFSGVIAYFSTREWNFNNRNVQNLWQSLSDVDKTVFPFSISDLDWNDYHKTEMLGLRTYLLKEDPSTLPDARRRWKRFYTAHQLLKIVFALIIVRILYAIVNAVLHFLV